jgi:hypothetical protein
MKSKKFLVSLARLFLPCAFDATDMNRLQAGTMGIWAYKSADALATIVASGYFNNHTLFMKKGDQILITAVLTGSVVRDSAVVTSADNAATVTVGVKA